MPDRRPTADEYAPFYAGYVDRLPDAPILPRLAGQLDELGGLLGRLRPGAAAFRYAPAKWTVGQVVGHLADAERIFGMRATCFARGETAPIPGFSENDYVAEGGFEARPLDSLVRELEHLRAANLEMFGALDADRWARAGTASGATVSVRALAWILAGHLDHHLGVLRDRYAAAFSDG